MRARCVDGAQKRCKGAGGDAFVLRNIGERVKGARLTLGHTVRVVAEDARVKHDQYPKA